MIKTNMRYIILYISAFMILAVSCNKEYDVPVPSVANSILKGTNPLDAASKPLMEGIYKVTPASSVFGDTIVIA